MNNFPGFVVLKNVPEQPRCGPEVSDRWGTGSGLRLKTAPTASALKIPSDLPVRLNSKCKD